MNYDNLSFYSNNSGYYPKQKIVATRTLLDKKIPFKTFLHYSEPYTRERTVFGRASEKLHYNYSDRLFSEEWNAGLVLAAEKAQKDTAEYFEIALNHFHGVTTVDLQHVILGCNQSNGFSYLIFGYTY